VRPYSLAWLRQRLQHPCDRQTPARSGGRMVTGFVPGMTAVMAGGGRGRTTGIRHGSTTAIHHRRFTSLHPARRRGSTGIIAIAQRATIPMCVSAPADGGPSRPMRKPRPGTARHRHRRRPLAPPSREERGAMRIRPAAAVRHRLLAVHICRGQLCAGYDSSDSAAADGLGGDLSASLLSGPPNREQRHAR